MLAAIVVVALGVTPPLSAIAAPAHGRVGVAARIVESGATLGLDERGHYPMQSVYKLPIAMALMAGRGSLAAHVKVGARELVPGIHSPLRDEHPAGVTLTLQELMRYAIVDSDGTASDVLLARAGGPEAVTRWLRGAGVDEMVVATSERAMTHGERVQERNWCTPRAALDVLRAAQKSPLLMRMMIESKPGAQRLKALLPAGTVVAHKTGSSGDVTNDIGVITLPDGRHLELAVFVFSDAVDLAAREAVIARIGRAVYDWAAGQSPSSPTPP